MLLTENSWLSTVDAFQSAAIGAQSWEAALKFFADATGSQSVQLTAIASDNAVLFDACTEIDRRPRIDPRQSNALYMAPLSSRLAHRDEVKVPHLFKTRGTAEQCRRDHLYHCLLRPEDRRFVFLTALERQETRSIVLAAARSSAEDPITTQQRANFTALAPHLGAAIRLHLILENQGTAVLAGTLDALSLPVFICDCAGRVTSLTRAAEALLASGRGLQLACSRLQACELEDAKALDAAIEAAAIEHVISGRPNLLTVIIRGPEHGAPPIALDVFALPAYPYPSTFARRVLVVAHGPRGSSARRAAILQSAYSLTPTETEIARQLAQGLSTERMAANRGVRIGTVRAQIKAIMAKVGVRRQGELVIRINQL